MANDWRAGLGLPFIQKVEDLLERTMRRRMDEALSVLAECDMISVEYHDWQHADEPAKDLIKEFLENQNSDECDVYVNLVDVLRVLERLGEIVIPTTEQKEDKCQTH